MSQAAPIFVVGHPRSGTTLLAAMLGAHSHLDCGPETLLFARLAKADPDRVLDPRTWPGSGVSFVQSLHLRDQSVAELFGQPEEAVRAYLKARPPSVAALLESLTAAHAAANGKPRWVEKTPGQLIYAEEIRAGWPEAQIVRLVRDPRAVALSMSRVPFAGETPAIHLVGVARADRLSRDFFRRDQGSLTIRYEDLVSDPQTTLLRVCEFLGEAFEPQMIERPESAGLAAPHEWWKAKASEPIDTSRIEAWRAEMSEEDARLAGLICRDMLLEHGYPGARQPRFTVSVVPVADTEYTAKEALALGLAAVDGVVEPTAPVDVRQLRTRGRWMFLGQFNQLGLELGPGRAKRFAALAELGLLLATRRLRGRPVPWVVRHTRRPLALDLTSRLSGRLVQLLARRVSAEEAAALLSREAR
jgi:Sulfotransferase family